MTGMDTLSHDTVTWLQGRTRTCPITRLRQQGVSSDALAHGALGVPIPDGVRPLDPADLAACYLTCVKAPAHLRLRMEPTLQLWRVLVAERYDLTDMDRRLAALSEDAS